MNEGLNDAVLLIQAKLKLEQKLKKLHRRSRFMLKHEYLEELKVLRGGFSDLGFSLDEAQSLVQPASLLE